MASRKQLWHPDEVRAKIQASQLINRLHDHAFGQVEMTATQLRAAEVLLKKAMPDLAAVTHQGDPEKPIGLTILTGVARP
jgi:hypothetical protein